MPQLIRIFACGGGLVCLHNPQYYLGLIGPSEAVECMGQIDLPQAMEGPAHPALDMVKAISVEMRLGLISATFTLTLT